MSHAISPVLQHCLWFSPASAVKLAPPVLNCHKLVVFSLRFASWIITLIGELGHNNIWPTAISYSARLQQQHYRIADEHINIVYSYQKPCNNIVVITNVWVGDYPNQVPTLFHFRMQPGARTGPLTHSHITHYSIPVLTSCHCQWVIALWFHRIVSQSQFPW